MKHFDVHPYFQIPIPRAAEALTDVWLYYTPPGRTPHLMYSEPTSPIVRRFQRMHVGPVKFWVEVQA